MASAEQEARQSSASSPSRRTRGTPPRGSTAAWRAALPPPPDNSSRRGRHRGRRGAGCARSHGGAPGRPRGRGDRWRIARCRRRCCPGRQRRWRASAVVDAHGPSPPRLTRLALPAQDGARRTACSATPSPARARPRTPRPGAPRRRPRRRHRPPAGATARLAPRRVGGPVGREELGRADKRASTRTPRARRMLGRNRRARAGKRARAGRASRRRQAAGSHARPGGDAGRAPGHDGRQRRINRHASGEPPRVRRLLRLPEPMRRDRPGGESAGERAATAGYRTRPGRGGGEAVADGGGLRARRRNAGRLSLRAVPSPSDRWR